MATKASPDFTIKKSTPPQDNWEKGDSMGAGKPMKTTKDGTSGKSKS